MKPQPFAPLELPTSPELPRRNSIASDPRSGAKEIPMNHPIAYGFCRSLEWILVALVCGCTLWVTSLAVRPGPFA